MSKRNSRAARRKKKSKTDSNSMKIIFAGVALVALAVYFNWDSTNNTEPIAAEEIILLGEQVFEQNCASCHGEQGEGHAALAQAPALNGSEHSWHHADGQIQTQILQGGIDMPSFGEILSNEEVVAVIRYFQTLWRSDQFRAQQANSAQNPMVE